MGSYITNAKAAEALAAVIKVYNVAGSFDSTVLDEDIDAVEGTVDSYVAGRYPVPVTGAAALKMIEGIVIDLLRAKGYGRLATVETPAIIMSNAKAARDTLNRISVGSLRLGDTAESTTERTASAFFVESDPLLMTKAKLRGF